MKLNYKKLKSINLMREGCSARKAVTFDTRYWLRGGGGITEKEGGDRLIFCQTKI